MTNIFVYSSSTAATWLESPYHNTELVIMADKHLPSGDYRQDEITERSPLQTNTDS